MGCSMTSPPVTPLAPGLKRPFRRIGARFAAAFKAFDRGLGDFLTDEPLDVAQLFPFMRGDQ